MNTAGVIHMEGKVKESELIRKVHSAVYHQCQQRGYAAPADVLIDIGALPKQKYEDWRFGKVRYLEAACTCNLKKLSFIMKQICSYAKKTNLKPSFCYYKRWGVKKKHGYKPVIPLRFSKSGNPEIEKAYATHYVDLGRTEQLKKEKMEKAAAAGQAEISDGTRRYAGKYFRQQKRGVKWGEGMEKEPDKKYETMKKIMDALEDILCSYQGRGHLSVYVDLDSLAVFANLIAYGQVQVENYRYDYDGNIREDKEAVRIYRELAPQTRWRVGQHTQIEAIRMNALKQLASLGTPTYQEQIYYADTGSALVCGEILPYGIFQLFTDMLEVKKLYPLPVPGGMGRAALFFF